MNLTTVGLLLLGTLAASKLIGTKTFVDNADFSLSSVRLLRFQGLNIIGEIAINVRNSTMQNVVLNGVDLQILSAKNDFLTRVVSQDVMRFQPNQTTRITLSFTIPLLTLISAMAKEGLQLRQTTNLNEILSEISRINFNISGFVFFSGFRIRVNENFSF